MKAVCPYCEMVFEKKRRNQVYCHTYCRQGDYLLRKSGRKEKGMGEIRSLSVEETYEGQSVENPSKPQTVVTNAGRIKESSTHASIKPLINKPDGSQSVEKAYDKQSVDNPSKAVQVNTGNMGVKWQIKAVAKGNSTSQPEIHPTDSLRENQAETALKKETRTKKRSKCVRRFEAPDDYWKRNVVVNALNPGNPKSNTSSATETPAPKPPAQDNFLPVDQIPPQLPHEQLTTYMAKHGLTLIVMPKQFTADLFPHWMEKEKLAFTIINAKVSETLKMLIHANDRNIKPDYLKEVINRLKELTSGIYRLFMPDDYPLLRFLMLIELKLKGLWEKIKSLDDFDYTMDDQIRSQVIFVCLQAENAEY